MVGDAHHARSRVRRLIQIAQRVHEFQGRKPRFARGHAHRSRAPRKREDQCRQAQGDLQTGPRQRRPREVRTERPSRSVKIFIPQHARAGRPHRIEEQRQIALVADGAVGHRRGDRPPDHLALAESIPHHARLPLSLVNRELPRRQRGPRVRSDHGDHRRVAAQRRRQHGLKRPRRQIRIRDRQRRRLRREGRAARAHHQQSSARRNKSRHRRAVLARRPLRRLRENQRDPRIALGKLLWRRDPAIHAIAGLLQQQKCRLGSQPLVGIAGRVAQVLLFGRLAKHVRRAHQNQHHHDRADYETAVAGIEERRHPSLSNCCIASSQSAGVAAR